MTSPPTQARTGNEQRIAFLECQLVTMREALEEIRDYDIVNGKEGICPFGCDCPDIARSALSSSADYAGKVVVDREEWDALLNLEKHAREWGDAVEDVDDLAAQLSICTIDLPRLDSLRQGGKG